MKNKLVIWSDEILKKVEELSRGEEKPIFVKIGEDYRRIAGIEDSQNIGWYEIRFDNSNVNTITTTYLKSSLPKDEMVMLQEGGHLGKSYPINSIYMTYDREIILKCDDPDSEYWEELEKWKIEQDNIKIGITNFMRDELERRKDHE